jgi:hypothetical protein
VVVFAVVGVSYSDGEILTQVLAEAIAVTQNRCEKSDKKVRRIRKVEAVRICCVVDGDGVKGG